MYKERAVEYAMDCMTGSISDQWAENELSKSEMINSVGSWEGYFKVVHEIDEWFEERHDSELGKEQYEVTGCGFNTLEVSRYLFAVLGTRYEVESIAPRRMNDDEMSVLEINYSDKETEVSR